MNDSIVLGIAEIRALVTSMLTVAIALETV